MLRRPESYPFSITAGNKKRHRTGRSACYARPYWARTTAYFQHGLLPSQPVLVTPTILYQSGAVMFNIDQFERLFRDYCVVWAAKSGRFVSEKRSTPCSGQRTLTPGARVLAEE